MGVPEIAVTALANFQHEIVVTVALSGDDVKAPAIEANYSDSVSGVRSHNFKLKGRRWSFQSLEREEKAAWAMFIRCWTSAMMSITLSMMSILAP